MNSFSYQNIFETKGIEYLAIITFFLILIPFWVFLNKKVKSNKIRKKFTPDSLKIPQGLYFNNYHTWAHLGRSGIAKVGMSEMLLFLSGEVAYRNLKEPGDIIIKGDHVAEIESKGRILRILSPISGEIIGTNSAINESPDILNEDPYIKGWMYKIKPSCWIKDTKSCFLADEATNWALREYYRVKDFIAESVVKYTPETTRIVLQDGGELTDHTLSEMPEDVWKEFQKNFLESE